MISNFYTQNIERFSKVVENCPKNNDACMSHWVDIDQRTRKNQNSKV